mmetsp:Transcript_41371/g.119022  ORF Transcript_41371/g.119022 Transcript_41371/m.119022 type:complete len:279 (-) Transcript_41371:984-1820(-)
MDCSPACCCCCSCPSRADISQASHCIFDAHRAPATSAAASPDAASPAAFLRREALPPARRPAAAGAKAASAKRAPSLEAKRCGVVRKGGSPPMPEMISTSISAMSGRFANDSRHSRSAGDDRPTLSPSPLPPVASPEVVSPGLPKSGKILNRRAPPPVIRRIFSRGRRLVPKLVMQTSTAWAAASRIRSAISSASIAFSPLRINTLAYAAPEKSPPGDTSNIRPSRRDGQFRTQGRNQGLNENNDVPLQCARFFSKPWMCATDTCATRLLFCRKRKNW